MEPFLQCAKCKKILYAPEFEQSQHVCQHCGHHHRLRYFKRIEFTFDPGSFLELDSDLKSVNPLGFPEYPEKLEQAEKKNRMLDSVVCGLAKLDGMAVSTAVADFYFMGGSMGSVNGEKIARTLERGVEQNIPVVIFCSSGGARMQEGLFSLMQLPKTMAAVHRVQKAKVPYIAVFTDPTMAGVLASYASVADVILAEPRAMVGFAGARVSKQAQVSKVPDDFQTAEFCLAHGMIDRIVERRDMRATLSQLVAMLGWRCYGR